MAPRLLYYKNFVRRFQLPDENDRYIWHSPLPEICDANNKPMPMVGTVKLLSKFTVLVTVELIVWESFPTAVILRADFGICSVEAIRPRKKFMDLNDGLKMPIARRAMKWSSTLPSLPREQQLNRCEGRLSTAVRATKTTLIPPHIQRMVKVYSKRSDFVVLQPEPKLYKRHSVIWANEVEQVVPDVSLSILIVNFFGILRRVFKCQVRATV